MATTSPLPQDIATALRYGPQTQQLMRRSSYLSDALRSMQEQGGQNIRSPGELAAKLLATAILQRSSEKARDATIAAVGADRKAQADSLLSAIRPSVGTQPDDGIAGAVGRATQPRAPNPILSSAPGLPSAQPQQQAQFTGQNRDLDAIVRTVWGEARNEDPTGQSAVASVILNRARQTGKSPADIVLEKNQFEPWGNPKTRAELEALSPNSPEYQAIAANIQSALSGQDVTGGADHFYSPTAQSALGRPPPAWDNGSGRDLGRHRFFSLGYGGGQPGQAMPQMPEAQPLQPEAGQQPMQPFQVASAGALQPGMIPSTPGPSAGAGPAASALPPQAGAGAANQQWPTWKPTQEQISYVESLLADPRTYEQGVAEAQKIRAKMAEPAPSKIVEMNGVQFYVSEVPGQGGQPVMIPVPQEARTQTLSAQQAGLPTAPQGAYVQQDPYGNLKEAPFAPPEGYNAGPNGYAPIRGGPADPGRVQAPPANYQLTPQGYSPIQGSAADPTNPMNVLQGTQQLRGEIKTVVDQAIQLKRNVDAVRTGFAQQNGPGDIAMVNGLQKLIDEGVVREGDVALQLKGQGIQGGIAGLQGYLTSEGFFADPKIRQGILNTANQLYGSLNDNYRARVMGYKPIADRTYGAGTFEQFVFPQETAQQLGWGAQAAEQPHQNIDRSGRPEGWSGNLPPEQLEMAKRFSSGGKPGSPQNPYVVATPEEARKLPPGSSILLPDGRIGKVPAR